MLRQGARCEVLRDILGHANIARPRMFTAGGGYPTQAWFWLEWGNSIAGRTWDIALKGRGFQPRRNASPLPLCHPERSMSVRRTVMRSREPALSEVEGDPMPVDTQQWPDRESSEILGPSAVRWRRV